MSVVSCPLSVVQKDINFKYFPKPATDDKQLTE